MRGNQNKANNNNNKIDNNNDNNNSSDNRGSIIPNSFRFISSYIKTVRSAGASVSGDSSDELPKDQVLYSCFDKLELSSSIIKHVLLLGYSNGFQVLDVDDGSNFRELVSTRDDPVTFLQIQPTPEENKGHEGFKMSHPLLLVVASEETNLSGPSHNERDESQIESSISSRAVRFYSLKSHSYVHVLRFRSNVYMVRCSQRIVAVGLASQIYCFDALTLESKFSVLTYPISQLGGQGLSGINIGYGPMAVGPRWLAYASNNPLMLNTGRLSPQNLSSSPGVSPSTSPGSGSLIARYAMESSKQLATGLINLANKKSGRAVAHTTENANAGMVVIKDFVSKEVISQFRAHTSPISALCFDPSGTLLVTASVHGNNINIFRILPSSSQNESGNQTFNWNSAHVHLYKLHRGMTSAVIQDICFSQYSQWISIVSSRGTCHIFLLSPFGGETSIQLHNSKVNRRALSAFVTVPWWFTSSFTKDQSLSPPPPAAITLSVVSRIKNVNWINTVSSVASGKTSVPPGAIAATFHSSCRNSEPAVLNADTLEHLLVYTPSGYVIQYELLPSIGDQGESSLRMGNASQAQAQAQDEEMRVKVDPLQWWDVCRRTDWPEKEEFIGGAGPNRHGLPETVFTNSDDDDTKHQERSRWYLSHAEVQIRSGRVPVWQNSKVHFYVMSPQLCEEISDGGEVDIEAIPVNEVEVKQKDLLPVFDSSLLVHPGWTDDRVFAAGRYFASSSNVGSNDEKIPQNSSVSRGSSLVAAHLQNLEQTEPKLSYPILASAVNNNYGVNRLSSVTGVDDTLSSSLDDIMNSPSPIDGSIAPARVVLSSESIVTSDTSNPGSNRSDLSMNIVDEVPMHEDMLEFGHDFQEEYCKLPTKEKTYVDGNDSLHQRNESEKDGDSDDMLGGVFEFSEEC
ncbi:autophagy-related protein 18h-like [Rutidosis leptorrhynchoides]|uniref:autophagy-related protein 18h-like n=1 Tax=Rutidosis leptorrhynchoides TaxID=125765 RepID=UPI003A995C7B